MTYIYRVGTDDRPVRHYPYLNRNSPEETPRPFDVAVGLFQSNMKGVADDYNDSDQYNDPDIWAYNWFGQQLVRAREPLPVQEPNMGMGAMNRFIKDYAATRLAPDRRLLIVNAARGGTGFSTPSTNPYGGPGLHWDHTRADDLNNLARIAVRTLKQIMESLPAGSRIVAYLANHGSTDGINGMSGPVFQQHLLDWIDWLRTEMGTPEIPYLMMQMRPDLIANENRHAVIDAAQLAVSALRPKVARVPSPVGQDYNRNDSVHFNARGMRVIGSDMFARYETLEVGEAPDVWYEEHRNLAIVPHPDISAGLPWHIQNGFQGTMSGTEGWFRGIRRTGSSGLNVIGAGNNIAFLAEVTPGEEYFVGMRASLRGGTKQHAVQLLTNWRNAAGEVLPYTEQFVVGPNTSAILPLEGDLWLFGKSIPAPEGATHMGVRVAVTSAMVQSDDIFVKDQLVSKVSSEFISGSMPNPDEDTRYSWLGDVNRSMSIREKRGVAPEGPWVESRRNLFPSPHPVNGPWFPQAGFSQVIDEEWAVYTRNPTGTTIAGAGTNPTHLAQIEVGQTYWLGLKLLCAKEVTVALVANWRSPTGQVSQVILDSHVLLANQPTDFLAQAVAPASATALGVRFSVSGLDSGEVIRAKDMLVNRQGGSFFSGNTPDTPTRRYSWLGTENSSVSIEESR